MHLGPELTQYLLERLTQKLPLFLTRSHRTPIVRPSYANLEQNLLTKQSASNKGFYPSLGGEFGS